jgi:hypothetical protein
MFIGRLRRRREWGLGVMPLRWFGNRCWLLRMLVLGRLCGRAKSKPRVRIIKISCAVRDGALYHGILVSRTSLQNYDGLLINRG